MSRPVVSGIIRSQGYVCSRCKWRQLVESPQRRSLHSTLRRDDKFSVLSLLEERGYVNQIAGDRNVLDELLKRRQVGFYAGIDPTAPSLHLGHLLPLMVLFWLYHHGHNVVSLVGGATARVGDPSGRLTSRAETVESVHDFNFKSMHAQVGDLWEHAKKYGRKHGYGPRGIGQMALFNNADWLDQLNVLDFLKLMGNGARLGAMLGRDTVRNKMEKGDGMSFSEFTYPLLQAWDWWHMYQNNGVQVQVGGSDQYGNIIAGMDAVKYLAQTNPKGPGESSALEKDGRIKDEMLPMGLTVPLLTTARGEKFGKSAGNAVWLSQKLTSSFDLYGFLLRSSDDDVERYLKLFTFIPLAEIALVMADHVTDPGQRKAQHLLASEVLELVHGREQAARTQQEHQTLRSPTLASFATPGDYLDSSEPSGTQRTVLPSSLVLNTPFSRILYHAGIVPTKSEGARLIAKGGVYLAKASSSGDTPDPDSLEFVQLRDQKPEDVSEYLANGLLIFRVGKWKVRVVKVVGDAEFEEQKLDAPGWEQAKQRRAPTA